MFVEDGGELGDDLPQVGGAVDIAVPAGGTARGPLETHRRIGAEVKGRARPLHGLGLETDGLEVHEAAVVLDLVLAPQFVEDIEPLVETGAPGPVVHVHGLVLVGDGAEADDQVETSAGEIVDGGDGPGGLQRMADRQHRQAGGEAHPAGHRRQVAEGHVALQLGDLAVVADLAGVGGFEPQGYGDMFAVVETFKAEGLDPLADGGQLRRWHGHDIDTDFHGAILKMLLEFRPFWHGRGQE